MATLQQLLDAQNNVQVGQAVSGVPGDRQTYIFNPDNGKYELAYRGFYTGTPGSDYVPATSDYKELMLPESMALRFKNDTQGAWLTSQMDDAAGKIAPGLRGYGPQMLSPVEASAREDGDFFGEFVLPSLLTLYAGGAIGSANAAGAGIGGSGSMSGGLLDSIPGMTQAPAPIVEAGSNIGGAITAGGDALNAGYLGGLGDAVISPEGFMPQLGNTPSYVVGQGLNPAGWAGATPEGFIPQLGDTPSYVVGQGYNPAGWNGIIPAAAGAAAASGAGSAAGSAAGTAAGTSAAAKWLAEKTGLPEGLIDLAGKAVPGLVGAFAADRQADAIGDLANREDARVREFMGFGAPYRSRLSELYANPSSFLSSPEVTVPVQQGTDALARSLSTRVGNPIGNPGALQEIQNYATNSLYGRLGQEKDRLAGFGGLTAYNSAGASGGDTTKLNLAGINADSNVFNALGDSAASIFTPKSSLVDLLKQLRM